MGLNESLFFFTFSFLDNSLIDGGEVVKLGAPAALYSTGTFLVFISVRGWVHPRAIVRLEGLGKLKNPMISTGIKPATLLTCSIVLQLTRLPRAPKAASFT
jgi:hypothetical protein